jgi:hypothetical protein
MMLWYDDAKDEMENKLLRAATFYLQKHGSWPNVAKIGVARGDKLDGQVKDFNGIQAKFTYHVSVNHIVLWCVNG